MHALLTDDRIDRAPSPLVMLARLAHEPAAVVQGARGGQAPAELGAVDRPLLAATLQHTAQQRHVPHEVRPSRAGSILDQLTWVWEVSVLKYAPA